MTKLTKTEHVLHHNGFEGNPGPTVEFYREPDEPGDTPVVVFVPSDLWVEMGSPRQVTVSVQPGDLLNA